MMIRSIYTKVCWKPELPAGDSPGKLRLLVGQRNSLEFMAAPNEPFTWHPGCESAGWCWGGATSGEKPLMNCRFQFFGPCELQGKRSRVWKGKRGELEK
jgi:hypothetical protein